MEAARRSADALAVATAARLVCWAAVALIAGDAVVRLWQEGRHVLAVAAGIGFPVTAVVWPWSHSVEGWPLWAAFLVAVVARGAADAARSRARTLAAPRSPRASGSDRRS